MLRRIGKMPVRIERAFANKGGTAEFTLRPFKDEGIFVLKGVLNYDDGKRIYTKRSTSRD